MVPMRRMLMTGLALTALVACASDAAPPTAALATVDVPSMNLRFSYPEALKLRESSSESLFAGSGTAIQVQAQPYRDSAPAITENESHEWALPRAVADEVIERRSCRLLRDERVYLPVDTSAPFRCGLVLDASGRAVLWMVGLGRPYRDVAFLQSALFVLEKDSYLALSYIRPFPEAEATVQWLAETFPSRHPGMSSLIWPNKSFLLHMEEARITLGYQVDPPSAEVSEAMEELERLAFSVGTSRGPTDR